SASETTWRKRTRSSSESKSACHSRRRSRDGVSADAKELERARVTFADDAPQPGVLRSLEPGVALEETGGGNWRALIQLLVAQRIGDPECRHAALPLTEQVTHAAQPKILARDLEPVVRSNEGLEPACDIGVNVAEENAERLRGASPDSAAKLMQL